MLTTILICNQKNHIFEENMKILWEIKLRIVCLFLILILLILKLIKLIYIFFLLSFFVKQNRLLVANVKEHFVSNYIFI